MIDSAFVAKYRKALLQEIEDKRFAISQGNITDMVQYNTMCAHILGLQQALDIFGEILKKYQTEED